MVFDIHQHELVTGIHAPLILSRPPTSLPTLSLWVVPEHCLWEHPTFCQLSPRPASTTTPGLSLQGVVSPPPPPGGAQEGCQKHSHYQIPECWMFIKV